MKKEEEILDDKADIVRFSALARMKAKVQAKERVDEEFSANITVSMEAER